MNRRHYLATTTALLAGCTSATSTDPDESDADVPDVTLSATDLEADDPDVSLEIAYNARTSTALTPGERTTVAEDGHKWLIVRMDVTNTGADTRELTAHQYAVESDGETYEVVAFNDHYLRGKTVEPGETTTGWLAYHVPLETESATLTARQDLIQERLAVAFTLDTSLSTAFPDA